MRDNGGGRGQKMSKLRDVIYGRPLCETVLNFLRLVYLLNTNNDEDKNLRERFFDLNERRFPQIEVRAFCLKICKMRFSFKQ